MLRFIYTDRAPNLIRMADELLAAADKVTMHDSRAGRASVLGASTVGTCESFFCVRIESRIESTIYTMHFTANI